MLSKIWNWLKIPPISVWIALWIWDWKWIGSLDLYLKGIKWTPNCSLKFEIDWKDPQFLSELLFESEIWNELDLWILNVKGINGPPIALWNLKLIEKTPNFCLNSTVNILAKIPYFFHSPKKWRSLYLPGFSRHFYGKFCAWTLFLTKICTRTL